MRAGRLPTIYPSGEERRGGEVAGRSDDGRIVTAGLLDGGHGLRHFNLRAQPRVAARSPILNTTAINAHAPFPLLATYTPNLR